MTSRAGFKILVVEDSATQAMQLQMLLDGLGHDSEVVRSATSARDALASERFDAVLLDLMLPDTEGIETVEALTPATDAPILVLTSVANEAMAIEALERGTQDYLLKAEINGHILGRALRYAVERQRVGRRLKELNVQKNHFLGVAAHDLRNPLGVITMYCRLLTGRKSDNLTDKQRAHIASIERTSAFMLQLVNDLLDLSRIESGEMSLDLEVTDPVAIARSVLELHSLAAESKGLVLEGRLPDTPLTVEVDRMGLQQVLNNLLSNAIKFTERGGRVVLGVDSEPSGVVFEVSDEGIGIPEHLMARLAQPDKTTQRHGTEGERGHGLGLAIVRKIVEGHGGSLQIQSKAGGGTTFSARFPTAPGSGI